MKFMKLIVKPEMVQTIGQTKQYLKNIYKLSVKNKIYLTALVKHSIYFVLIFYIHKL